MTQQVGDQHPLEVSDVTLDMRWMAVMMTDMEGSTEYAAKHEGDEVRTRAKQDQHNELLIPLLEPHGGQLIRTFGDALMVIIRILARANQVCCLSLLNLGANGRIEILLPNAYEADPWLQANQWRAFPSPHQPSPHQTVVLPLEGPPGLERILALASAEPLQLDPADFDPASAFARFLATPRSLDAIAQAVQGQVLGHCELQFYVSDDTPVVEPLATSARPRGGRARGGVRLRGGRPRPTRSTPSRVAAEFTPLEPTYRWLDLE